MVYLLCSFPAGQSLPLPEPGAGKGGLRPRGAPGDSPLTKRLSPKYLCLYHLNVIFPLSPLSDWSELFKCKLISPPPPPPSPPPPRPPPPARPEDAAVPGAGGAERDRAGPEERGRRSGPAERGRRGLRAAAPGPAHSYSNAWANWAGAGGGGQWAAGRRWRRFAYGDIRVGAGGVCTLRSD